MKSDREARQRALDAAMPRTLVREDQGSPPRGAGTSRPMVAPAAATTDLDRMNQLETQYSQRLDARLRMGEIVRWRFQALSLRLSKRTYSRPDFWVQFPDGHIEIHQVKGPKVWDDARPKDKWAAKEWPEFTWVWVTEGDTHWIEEVL